MLTLFAGVFVSVTCVAAAAAERYDVVVYGGTSGGVAAAIQVARRGKSVVLIEPSRHLGGLTTGGLGATDVGNRLAIGGIAREFYQRVGRHYRDPAVWKHERREDFKGRGHSPDEEAAWTFEPHVASKVYAEMLKDAEVPVLMAERLDLKAGVRKKGARITAIVMESGRHFEAKMFLDATYEGDLMAKAGVTYALGREANAVYGETLNGVQKRRNVKQHRFLVPVDPYRTPGDPSSGLLPEVSADDPGAEGEGDHRVQAYCFRLCMTDVPENRRPWPKPAGYDPLRYELLLRNFEAGDHRLCMNPVLVPNRKTDTNNNGAFSTDFLGANYDYPDGDHATRRRIIEAHRVYQQGLFWTLANHPRVPQRLRQYAQTWGLAKDEFVATDNWPPQLYVREARRMKGAYVMTEQNCAGSRVAPDSVGLGAYGMDSHNVQRYVDDQGKVQNEGDVQVHGFSPYPVSYRAIVPEEDQCTNLLVPVCLSASHIAYGSIRMEPVFMVLGQSAATAACLALDEGSAVQQLSYDKLRERLEADRQVLRWTGPARRLERIDRSRLPGILLDDADARLTGAWSTSQSLPRFVEDHYLHDGDKDKGQMTARFVLPMPKAGRYEVRISYAASANRASNVPVTIEHADGTTTVRVNQRQPPAIDRLFISLGTFTLAPDRAAVTISNDGTDGHVIVDAVQVLAAK